MFPSKTPPGAGPSPASGRSRCPYCGHDGGFTHVEDAQLLREVKGINDGVLLVRGHYAVNDEGTADTWRISCPACEREFAVPRGLEVDFVG
jgi:hypothetical protein